MDFLYFFLSFVFFYPNVLGHTDNYIPANPLVTPTHIVPEWYFLPFYAILRSIPDKLMGVVSLLNSILVLLIVPFLFQNEKLNKGFLYSFYHKFLCWFFFFNCLVLGWIGGKSIETPYYEIGQTATFFYFFYFFLILFFDFINDRQVVLMHKFLDLNFIRIYLVNEVINRISYFFNFLYNVNMLQNLYGFFLVPVFLRNSIFSVSYNLNDKIFKL